MQARIALLLTPLAATLACSTDPGYGNTTSQQRRSNAATGAIGGGSGPGASSGNAASNGTANSTTGTGSTSGASSGGSTSGNLPDAGCASSEAQLTAYAYNLYNGIVNMSLADSPAPGVIVDTQPSFGPPATTDATGLFSLCVPLGVTFNTTFTNSNFLPMVMEAQNLQTSQSFLVQYGGAPMISMSLLSVIAGGLPNYDPTRGGVLVAVTSISDETHCQRSGWAFTAQSVDGGPVDGGWPIAYVDYSGNTSPNPPTTEAGLALIYNIDPSAPAVSVTALNQDAGTSCAPLPNTGFTGQVPVPLPTPNQVLSFFPILVP